MTSDNKGKDETPALLHKGAERGSNPSKTEQVQHGPQEIGRYRLHFDIEKAKQPPNWANVSDFGKICRECLRWPEHNAKCPRHLKNTHMYATEEEIGKRAKDIDSTIMGRLVKKKNDGSN
jgi:hypothetical protein